MTDTTLNPAKESRCYGSFLGKPMERFSYPMFDQDKFSIMGYYLPFYEWPPVTPNPQITKRRFVVPESLLNMPSGPDRTDFVYSMALLYVASVIDAVNHSEPVPYYGAESLGLMVLKRYQGQGGTCMNRFNEELDFLRAELQACNAQGHDKTDMGELLVLVNDALDLAVQTLIKVTVLKEGYGIVAAETVVSYTAQEWIKALRSAEQIALGQHDGQPGYYLVREGDSVNGFELKIVKRAPVLLGRESMAMMAQEGKEKGVL